MEVTEQPEPGNFAKMDVTYMKATISEMYARRMYFDGLNTLTSLATKNKNSFSVAAGLFQTEEDTASKISPSVEEQYLKAPAAQLTGTQGRKGAKLRRMNIPVTDEEYEAIRRGSRAAGMTYGEYVYTAVLFYQAHGEK